MVLDVAALDAMAPTGEPHYLETVVLPCIGVQIDDGDHSVHSVGLHKISCFGAVGQQISKVLPPHLCLNTNDEWPIGVDGSKPADEHFALRQIQTETYLPAHA